jgi:putative ABC transport system permease protein
MNIKVVAGRRFSKINRASDVSNAVIINQAAAKKLGWQSPEEAIGKTIEYFVSRQRGFLPAQVVGVMSDFHYQSLRSAIEPLIVRLANEDSVPTNYLSTITNLSIKIRGTNVRQTIAEFKNAWQKINSSYPFEYTFLDDRLRKLYSSDEKLGQVFSKFSYIVLFITAIGLFGISILTIEQRTKEIGVRKVLGANVTEIVALLSKDFLKLVAFAVIIASPIAWYAMHEWLQSFAYRTNISWVVFAITALIAFGIASITIGFQAIKAAIANPVKSLRTE